MQPTHLHPSKCTYELLVKFHQIPIRVPPFTSKRKSRGLGFNTWAILGQRAKRHFDRNVNNWRNHHWLCSGCAPTIKITHRLNANFKEPSHGTAHHFQSVQFFPTPILQLILYPRFTWELKNYFNDQISKNRFKLVIKKPQSKRELNCEWRRSTKKKPQNASETTVAACLSAFYHTTWWRE